MWRCRLEWNRGLIESVLSKTFLTPLIERILPIINLHPSLPDQFKGVGAIKWAWEALQSGEEMKV